MHPIRHSRHPQHDLHQFWTALLSQFGSDSEFAVQRGIPHHCNLLIKLWGAYRYLRIPFQVHGSPDQELNLVVYTWRSSQTRQFNNWPYICKWSDKQGHTGLISQAGTSSRWTAGWGHDLLQCFCHRGMLASNVLPVGNGLYFSTVTVGMKSMVCQTTPGIPFDHLQP
jgi:hypothetical protein